jgi:hypothetical protein
MTEIHENEFARDVRDPHKKHEIRGVGYGTRFKSEKAKQAAREFAHYWLCINFAPTKTNVHVTEDGRVAFSTFLGDYEVGKID